MLPRKQARPRKQVKNHLCTGFNINYLDKGDYYGFTLDGNGRFLLGDFTITHNTHTLIECLKHIPSRESILVVAFNKNIADELREKAPSYVMTSTLHSLGYKAIREHNPKVAFVKYKAFNIIQSFLNEEQKKTKANIAFTLSTCKVISLCKSYLIDSPSKIS